jgi:hypothetical protein
MAIEKALLVQPTTGIDSTQASAALKSPLAASLRLNHALYKGARVQKAKAHVVEVGGGHDQHRHRRQNVGSMAILGANRINIFS